MTNTSVRDLVDRALLPLRAVDGALHTRAVGYVVDGAHTQVLGELAGYGRMVNDCLWVAGTVYHYFDDALLERLKAWRLGVAKRQSVPAFVVFTDATLMALAQAEPSDERGLLEIRGIGRSKARRYGQDVLAIIGGLDVDEVLAGARAPGDDQPSGG